MSGNSKWGKMFFLNQKLINARLLAFLPHLLYFFDDNRRIAKSQRARKMDEHIFLIKDYSFRSNDNVKETSY